MKNGSEKFWMLEAMKDYGGSFVRNLGVAWQCADEVNSEKLEKAFPEIKKKYVEMGERLCLIEKQKEESPTAGSPD